MRNTDESTATLGGAKGGSAISQVPRFCIVSWPQRDVKQILRQ